MTIDVIPVKRLPRGLAETFTYFVPAKLEDEIKLRQIVEVAFRNKLVNAVVVKINKAGRKARVIKTLVRIVTPFTFVTKQQLELVEFISRTYFVSPATALLGMAKELPKKITNNLPLTTNQKIKKQTLHLVPEHQQVQGLIAQLPNSLYWRETQSKKLFFDNWLKVASGEAKTIVGTRSALFAPFKNLAEIIMEDEADDSYKSEQSPRYHAREVAQELARLHKAKLTFKSTALSLEAYHRNHKSTETIKAARERKGVIVVDIKKERENENYSSLSETLQAAIEKSLKAKQQVFLFLNRKGDSTAATCHDCGYTILCPDCRLPLAYHSYNNKLICHHCRYRTELPPFCSKCSSSELRLTGKGTQKLYREVKKLFPKAKVLRLDKDSKVTGYPLPVTRFDVVIGTEYALSRINWSNIGVIGVINADASFYRPDFRASERQYQLLMKIVTGFKLPVLSSIIAQTYNPSSNVIQAIAKNKPELFYEPELKLRKALGYPPFKTVIKLIYRNTNEKKAVGAAMHIYNRLRKHLLASRKSHDRETNEKVEILKPFPVYERKVRNKFQFNLILKFNPKDDIKISKQLNLLVPPDWIFDRDPETLL